MLVKDTASASLETQDSVMSTKQTANLVYMGPVSGNAALATFRALQLADLPGGGGSASAYFPQFYGFKAVNGGIGITTTSTSLLGFQAISTIGTVSSQSATPGKALRARFTTSATATNSAGFCESATSGTPISSPCIRTLGTTTALILNMTLQQTTNMRFWFGLTDTAANTTSTALTLSAAANASGGTTVYTGTITGGGSNAFSGQYFTVTGFANGANNGGPWLCSASSGTTLTLANTAGVAETHAGTATYGVALSFRSDIPNANFVGFRFSTAAGDTKWKCVAQTSSTSQTVNTATGSNATPDATNEFEFVIAWDSFNSQVVFYINGAQVGSIPTSDTNLPSRSLVMQPFVIIDNVGTANAQSLEVSQLRGQ